MSQEIEIATTATVSVFCVECCVALDAEVDGDGDIVVTPCADCLGKARDEGYKQAKGEAE